MESDEQLSHEQVRKPGFTRKAVSLHRELVEADELSIPSWRRAATVYVYHYSMLLFAGISRTELTRRAAALTYTTILSIFPLLAVVTSMLSYFYTSEKEAELTSIIERTLLPSTNQVLDVDPSTLTENERQLLQQQKDFADNIRKMFADVSAKFRKSAGGVGIFGFIGVLVTAGLLYYSIESVVNQTWQTGASRWTDTIRNLILVLLFAPMVIGLSMTASTMAATLFGEQQAIAAVEVAKSEEQAATVAEDAASDIAAVEAVEVGEAAKEAAKAEILRKAQEEQAAADANKGLLYHVRKVTTQFEFVLKVIPLLFNTLILSLAYSFLPNTRVGFRAALFGGAVAAILWELARYLFFYYVYMSAMNRTLADALGLSVIFLIWVYITWMILLLGNLVVYTTHNYRSLWAERRGKGEMMLDGRLLVATMLLLARRFKHHAPGYTESELRQRLGLRKDEFTQVSGRLLNAGYIARLESGAYQIAQPAEDVLLRDLLALGCNLSQLPVVSRIGPVSTVLTRLQEETLAAVGDKRLNELLA